MTTPNWVEQNRVAFEQARQARETSTSRGYCPRCHVWLTEGGAIGDLSPDAPVATNAAGGKQSALPYRCDLLPARAVLAVAQVLAAGAHKYAPDNWRKIARHDHLNHAITHLLAHLAGDTPDAHLEHAACRLLMALEATEEVTDGSTTTA